MAVLAACSDSPVQSHQATSMSTPAAVSAGWGNYSHDANGDAHTYADPGSAFASATVSVDPNQPHLLQFGLHTLTLPAGSICDPSSSYGLGTWDLPCTPATQPITIQAVWATRRGHGYIEFQPALRFVPGKVVMLTIWDKVAIKNGSAFIGWRDPNGGWVNEALTDPSLKTWIAPGGFMATRRIKHFSGYNIISGESCDPTTDLSGNCIAT